eukprot:SAG31_NODE_1526_length_8004_cov_4.741176_9_plen_191_part_00
MCVTAAGWVWAPEVRSATANADFTRRAQLMLFSALASMDGWNTGFVPWDSKNVDAASEAMFSHYARERAKLQPFLYAAYQRQSVSGVPVVRAMTVDYDSDVAGYEIADQYLLGDGLMVAPVLDQSASHRSVHFPANAATEDEVEEEWVDYWSPGTSPIYKGGTQANVSAPLTTLPLFQRRGSIIPKQVSQ